jgi:Peptidase A4 family
MQPAASQPTLTNSIQTITAPNLAGYIAFSSTGTVTFRFVSVHFTVPLLDCQGVTVSQAAAQHWVGLGGTEEVGVETDCNGTTPAYRAFWAFRPNFHFPSITINPGNSIQMSVFFNTTTREYTFTLTDSSNGQGFTRTTSCPSAVSCSRRDVNALTEAPINPTNTAVFLPLADFQASSFDDVHVTNTSGSHRAGLRSSFWSTLRVGMVSQSDVNFSLTGVALAPGLTLANTTSLYNKNTFLVYWNPNNAG